MQTIENCLRRASNAERELKKRASERRAATIEAEGQKAALMIKPPKSHPHNQTKALENQAPRLFFLSCFPSHTMRKVPIYSNLLGRLSAGSSVFDKKKYGEWLTRQGKELKF